MRLDVSRGALCRLRLKALALIEWVGQLGERVRVLPAENDQLESLDEPWIVFAWTGERRASCSRA